MANFNMDAVRKATAELLGNDIDLWYITDELLASGEAPQVIDATDRNWEKKGNRVTVLPNGHTQWRDECAHTPVWDYAGRVTTTRLPNCANGFLYFRIKPA
jgi:hypothetical protein